MKLEGKTLEQIKRYAVKRSLIRNHGIVLRAARELNISQRGVRDFVKKYKIDLEGIRNKKGIISN